ncbi:ead/Ea22-like family protein [Klebsiella pneumoniae]
MTDITELAQRNELLIANGQQTADLLRHLADNEIDSDYFAVVSECESYGKETDAELSITEFALRAAGYVDSLVEALEKAQCANAAQDDHINQQQDRIDQLEKGHQEAAKQINSWRRMAKQNIAEREKDIAELDAARQRIAELESRTVKLPKLKMLEDYLAEVAIEERKQILVGVKLEFHRALAAAGIKVEVE